MNYFASKMILLNILQDVAIYSCKYFVFAHNGNFSKRYISILQNKSNFFVLHNFTKNLYSIKVSQLVNKCFTGDVNV